MNKDIGSLATTCDGDTKNADVGERPAVCHSQPTADLTLPLPGGNWHVWRTVALRGAGFPAATVTPLAAKTSLAAADAYSKARHEVITRRREALRELDARCRASTDRDERIALRRRRRLIKKGAVSASSPLQVEQALAAALTARNRCYETLVSEYELDARDNEETLVAIAGSARFREAALWQSAQALRHATRILAQRRGSAGDRRNAAVFLAQLLQRLATKNDSFAFFGPVGWGQFSDDAVVVDAQPGPTLLARREVCFEGWAIDAFAARLNRSPALKPWSLPRRKAGIWIAPDGVFSPLVANRLLTLQQRQVLRCCDGTTTARAIAMEMVARNVGLVSEEQVFEVLQSLVVLGLVVWEFEVAPQRYPERELALRLAKIGDASLRERFEADLRELTMARDRVAQAADDWEQLDRALTETDQVFTRVTGMAASRRPGQMYAARGVLFQDCRRDYDFTLGTTFLVGLGPPLSIVLDGARWVATQLRSQITRHVRDAFAILRSDVKTEAITAQTLLNQVSAAGQEILAASSEAILADARHRWVSIVGPPDSERRVSRSADALRERSRDAFTCQGPSSWGCYFTPDIMVATPDFAAFQRGEFHAVLGEVHSSNAMLWSGIVSLHPDLTRIEATLAHDTQEQTVVLVQTPKAQWLSRMSDVVLPTFLRYEYGADLPSLPRCHSLPAGQLVAEDDGGEIKIKARDGSVSFAVFELFARTLRTATDRIVSAMLVGDAYCPRITIDDLTVCREQWVVAVREMPFLNETNECLRFALIRDWVRARGFPRRVFFRSPKEPKPCYLDFDSPQYVTVFIKLMRHLPAEATVRIVEMLPDLDQTWLEDAQGSRYTSELRIVARHDYGR